MKVLCGVTMISLALTVTAPIFATSLQEANQKKQELEKSLEDSKTILEGLNTLKSNTDEYIAALDEKLQAIEEDIMSLEAQEAAKQTEIDETQGKLKEQEELIESQYDSMKKRIQFMFENGNTFYLEMMFGTESISDMLNKAEYINELEEYDRDMLRRMEETQNAIEETKNTLLTQQADLQLLQQQKETEESTVEDLIADKQKELDSYQQQIQDTQAKIEENEKELKQEQELIEQMKLIEAQRAAAAAAGSVSTSFVYTGQQFIWPLEESHRITSEFGYRTDPIDGSTSYHSGLDIGAPSGTEIHAVADGQVAWSYYSTTAGNWIGIDHGNNVYSVYMHCSLAAVEPGAYVKQGDVIGYVGSTGRSTGPHLHLSIRVNGEYVDPHMYVGY